MKNNSLNLLKKLSGALFLFVFLVVAAYHSNPFVTEAPQSSTEQPWGKQPGKTVIHFLDVGQGDSIFVELPDGRHMLIDAGTRAMGKNIVNYLEKAGVEKIDFLIATHPHEDHIGGLSTVLQGYEIGQIYMPKVTHNTKTYENLLQSIQAKKLKINKAMAGTKIINAENLCVEIIAPNMTVYENINNYSAVIKLTHGKIGFLLTGDAEAGSEKEMLENGFNLKADVLKVGHHGSNSSTTPAFLDEIRPQYAVISSGVDNDYGHPHMVTLQKLSGIKIFRTDLNGNIVFTTDGENLQVSTER
ncbi:MAG: MBL fold metallo-hydrolase [Peptococcaceae bacterium]|nr:MBL fold metallo-hydrolase [Bacillota bacterium]NQS75681.1 MBL fold metallo-hydrolase [Candidatus Syntrophopropionicum ammoniitolerans]